jgi:dolichol kinase
MNNPKDISKSKKGLSEYIRKAIHISSLIIPLTYRYILSYNRFVMFIFLFITLITALSIELSRMQIPNFRKLYNKLFGLILRRHESKDFTGATFLVFASMLCVVFFTPGIAFLSISYLAIGDTFAALVGMARGERKFNGMKKSLEGSLACFVSILIYSIIFGIGINPVVYVAGCFAATAAELWDIPVDDNVKIPLISGIVMTLVNVFI